MVFADPLVCTAGHIVDAMLKKADASKRLSVHDLWHAVMYGFEKTWPATRTHVGDTPMGDVWTYSGLPSAAVLSTYVASPVTDPRALNPQLVPFHKVPLPACLCCVVVVLAAPNSWLRRSVHVSMCVRVCVCVCV